LLASGADPRLSLPPFARFFPRFDEPDGTTLDPLETTRPDWLGVRTRQATREQIAPGASDNTTRLASADEEPPPALPVVVRIAVSPDSPESGRAQGAIANVVEVEPARKAIALEYVDDPQTTGRPPMGAAGAAVRAQRSRFGPTRYGPEPTYPAAYYPTGSVPMPAPRTRELWPGTGTARPALLARVWRRLRTATGGDRGNTPAATPADANSALASAGTEPRNLAEHGEGVERIAFDRLDESAKR
jgi:hypothetical protein